MARKKKIRKGQKDLIREEVMTDRQLANRGIVKLHDYEEFRKLKRYPKYYISNFGRIYSTISGRIITPTVTIAGKQQYYIVNLSCKAYITPNGKRKTTKIEYVHKLVFETFCDSALYELRKDEITDHWDIHHVNHNSLDNRWFNLVKLYKKVHNIANDIKSFKVAKNDVFGKYYKIPFYDLETYTEIPLDTILLKLQRHRCTIDDKTYVEVTNDKNQTFIVCCTWIPKKSNGNNRKVRKDIKRIV